MLLTIYQVESEKKEIIEEYKNHVKKAKNAGLGGSQVLPQSEESTTILKNSGIAIHNDEEDRPSSLRRSGVLDEQKSSELGVKRITTVQKLQLTFPSLITQDELDLKKFLESRDYLSKKERKYLLKYVLKGLPPSLRGRVSVLKVICYSQFWLISSGALAYLSKHYDQNYY